MICAKSYENQFIISRFVKEERENYFNSGRFWLCDRQLVLGRCPLIIVAVTCILDLLYENNVCVAVHTSHIKIRKVTVGEKEP